ncbi:unnamed protein product [Closterium sp. NIES-54]
MPQQLREWCASWGCRGGRGGSRPGAGRSGASCSDQVQLQQRPRAVLSPQQLREWYAQSRGSWSTARCPYVIRTGARAGQPCGTVGHTESRCFVSLSDAWRTKFDDDAELPSRLELLRQRVDIFALDYDAILTVMYALPTSAEGAYYLCVPRDPGIESAALGAGEAAALGAGASPTPGAGEAAALGASESTAPGAGDRPVAVSLADPSGGPVLAHSSTVLPCSAVPSGSLSSLHLPSFSTNLVSGADLQDAWVDQFTPGGQRATHYSCTRTGRHLATFTHQPGSSLYSLTTVSPLVAESGQVAASGQVFAAAPRSAAKTPIDHQKRVPHFGDSRTRMGVGFRGDHRLDHPSLPRLRGMASRVLVTGLPRSLPSLPPGPAPTCVPCVEGRQRAAPHSSEFPPTEAPLQTLHMDVWGPSRVRGQGHEHYFLLVVDDYSRYTTVFPLCCKGEVTEVLIDWIRAARRQLSESFGSDLPVLRLHFVRGGEFSSNILRAFCRAEGIRETFTLPASPQQNGIAERRIGMVMDVARTSMIHAATPHFLCPFAVQYAAHQLNLLPRVSMPETTPTLRWMGKVGDASAFRVWGSRAFVRDLSTDKLSSRAIPCVFLGFPPDAPGWQFYHPTSRHVLSSQDVTFDESVPYYRLFPYRSAPLPPPRRSSSRQYTWGEKEQAVFTALKNILCSPPVLHIADPHRPFKLVTDASDIAVGAVLLQDFENGLQHIAYESRKLHLHERNYPIHDREMLAIVHALKVWRCYLTGADVTPLPAPANAPLLTRPYPPLLARPCRPLLTRLCRPLLTRPYWRAPRGHPRAVVPGRLRAVVPGRVLPVATVRAALVARVSAASAVASSLLSYQSSSSSSLALCDIL